MEWTDIHAPLLSKAFENVLGRPEDGSMAFARCLTTDVAEQLASDSSFAPCGWEVLLVADTNESELRTVTADRAVEIRETKERATLLLIDTTRAGAGIDGIYNASREVDETELFREARRLVGRQITKQLSSANRRFAETAIKRSQGHGRTSTVSQWAEFDFLCRVLASQGSLGAHVHLLGLWNFIDPSECDQDDTLDSACMFVDRLLGPVGASTSPTARIASVRLDRESERNKGDLERFLNSVDTKPLLTALRTLADLRHLWIGALRTKSAATSIQGFELISWRNRNGSIAKWSGLTEETNENDSDEVSPPVLVLEREANKKKGGTLEIRWKAEPAELEKAAAEYRVSVLTDVEEELIVSDNILHSARRGGERWRFTRDDFSSIPEDALLSAKVVVTATSNQDIEPQVSEEFIIRFGDIPDPEVRGFRETIRTFSEGLADLGSRDRVSMLAERSPAKEDSKGFILLRTREPGRRKSFRVFRPSLVAEVEEDWIAKDGQIGRWTVQVRGSGRRAGRVKFEAFEGISGPQWARTKLASERMADHFRAGGGGVGQVYDAEAKSFAVAQEYLRAWSALLETSDPLLAIANTVEVQSLAGKTIGLIVMPAHPLRLAWHVAYDNLVFHTAFNNGESARDIRAEFTCLDGAMFPAFLPNPHGGTFVFADTLGFHAVGMVPDIDDEPKAAIAILAQALGDGLSDGNAPITGGTSANVVANELIKYLECHKTEDGAGTSSYASPLLQVHALRAGDGLTVARALGKVHDHYRRSDDDDGGGRDADIAVVDAPVFSLELYSSREQRGVAGRFIADAREKRRSGAGVLASQDRWMLTSIALPSGVRMPWLRWARKEPSASEIHSQPKTAAHVAIAFNTFESNVTSGGRDLQVSGPYHAFGLLSYYHRLYTSDPSPSWISVPVPATEGEKHPSRRSHTEILTRLQHLVSTTVARHLGFTSEQPVIKTAITPEKAVDLRNLHRLCDWVITLDRNVGIEYFDSPGQNREVYETYVIDCVPEREELGCLQMITSTTNLDEVRNLLDNALDQMGLSRSRRNSEFLLEHLKALSGRLAIRLSGHRPATSELIALAMSHANCRTSSADDECWVSLERGFIVPVDDIRDILPPFKGLSLQGQNERRPDLIYVTGVSRKGLTFQFIEVKYRRHLRDARAPMMLLDIEQQTQSLRSQWYQYYCDVGTCDAFRSIRRAKLSRVLRFYADKAHRHHLSSESHLAIVSEIDRMIERGSNYVFASANATAKISDLGWVFCPEYAGQRPLRISSPDRTTRVYLFGSSPMPDADSRFGMLGSTEIYHKTGGRLASFRDHRNLEADSDSRVQQHEAYVANDNSCGSAPSAPRVVDRESNESANISLGTELHGDGSVHWPLTVRGNPHLLVAGLPGMGKTTCLLNLCTQMVSAGVRPLVFSYHQDIDDQLEELLGSVRFVDFDGLGFNPLSVVDLESPRAYLDVAGSLRDVFSAIFPELGDLQCENIRSAIKESFVEAGWSVSRRGLEEPDFSRFVEILRSIPKPNRGLQTLLVRLAELEDYGFFEAGSSSQSLWMSDSPIVIRIHTTQNETLQRAFASLVFYGLYKQMFRRGIQERITHALIFDEAHRAAGLKLIPTMAKECRKYGISLVLASQEARDFNTSLFSAIANYLILRLTEADAKALVRNVATARQERTLVDRIKQMERFAALYFSEGEQRPVAVSLSPLAE